MSSSETEIDCGMAVIMGTNWPIVCTVSRERRGRHPWLLTLGLCNGSPSGAYWCRSKLTAVFLAEAYRDDRFQEALDQLLPEKVVKAR